MVPIQILIVPNGAAPVAICDHCGKRIEDAAEGNYEWDGNEDEEGALRPVFLLHKDCSQAHEAAYGALLDSMELIDLLPYLAHNLKLNWEGAQRHANSMSQLR